MISDFLGRIWNVLFTWVGYVAAGRYWVIKAAFFSTLLSLFLSFPREEILFNNYSNVPEMQAVMKKAENPLLYSEYKAGSHEAKLTFRMTMPYFIHFTGIGCGMLKVVEILCGILIFVLSTLLAFRSTGDRLSAVLVSFTVASIYAGTCSFVEFRGMFDGISILLLLGALYFRNPLICFVLLFVAAWTDERALLASGIVFVFRALSSDSSVTLRSSLKSFRFWYSGLGLLVLWGLYGYLRFRMATGLGMKTDTCGVGLSLLIAQLNNLPLGLWSAFEGAWIIIILGCLGMFFLKRYFLLAAFLGAFAAVLCAAMSVGDITRSMVYLLPAFFVALQWFYRADSPGNVRKYMMAALLICVLWPSLHAGGKDAIWWHSTPLPVQLLRIISLLH